MVPSVLFVILTMSCILKKFIYNFIPIVRNFKKLTLFYLFLFSLNYVNVFILFLSTSCLFLLSSLPMLLLALVLTSGHGGFRSCSLQCRSWTAQVIHIRAGGSTTQAEGALSWLRFATHPPWEGGVMVALRWF